MTISIPGMQGGFTTVDIILEQKILCELNIKTIKENARVRIDREVNDEINRRIRLANDFLGMAGSRKLGCLYFEDGVDGGGVCEHVIPIAELVSRYQSGIKFEELIFYPVARISKESDKKLTSIGLGKRGYDLERPFKRYVGANICIKTHHGDMIDACSWSMRDHWSLVFGTEELKEILKSLQFEKPNA